MIKTLAASALAALAVLAAPTASAQTASTTGYTNPTVGALFTNTSTNMHGCTASVVHSSSGDLILTAGHCVHGTGVGMKFAPGYVNGLAPYGTWTTTAAYVPSTWVSYRNPQADVAVLRLDHPVEPIVGANVLVNQAPPQGLSVTVPAYATGSGDHQRSCTANVFWTGNYPGFSCGGYPGGVSGSPFLHNGSIYGVIGGLHQGGCYSTTSYSTNMTNYGGVGPYLVTRAENHWAANTNIPSPGSDGC